MHLDHELDPKEVQKRLATVYPTDPVKVSLKCSSRDDWIRFVTCWEITDEDIIIANEKIRFVLREYEEKLRSSNNTKKNKEELERQYLKTQAMLKAQDVKSKS